MKLQSALLTAAILVLLNLYSSAATLYVDLNSANPTPPYADWSTAATNIQDAIDASTDGDLVLVTNGVYATGGRVVYGSLTNRVVIDKAITVQSINGPTVTLIQGYQVPGSINGSSAVRCVYMADNASLTGFTLTGGATSNSFSAIDTQNQSGGGIWCESSNAVISNCVIIANSCFGYGAGVYGGTLSDCQVINNTNRHASFGGGNGSAYSTLLNSIISGNVGTSSGAFSCTLSNCVLTGNTGGGADNCILNDCIISNNTSSGNGGGATQSTLTNCVVYDNQATNAGGGAYDCVLNNCTISNNWAGGIGGGVYDDTFETNSPGENNLLIGNTAHLAGGFYLAAGMSGFGLTNWNLNHWIFISNSAVSDGGGLYLTSAKSVLNNCSFLGNSSSGNGGGLYGPSPSLVIIFNCVFSGNIATGNGGGAYSAALNNCSVVGNQASNGGGVYGMANNCVFDSNFATNNGGGVFVVLSLGLPVICNGSFFTNNSAVNGGGAYSGIFSNCIFSANSAVSNGGGSYIAAMKNCLVISNQAAFGGGAFMGGDSVPLYPGTQATYIGCEIVGNSASVDGGGIYNTFSINITNSVIENNSATNNGGGIYGGMFGKCTLMGNTAGANGGGGYGGNFSYCVVSNNVAGSNGGGTYNTFLINCLVNGNSAANGGGSYLGTINNSTLVGNKATSAGGGTYYPSGGNIVSSVIYDNAAPSGANYSGIAAYNYCCSVPMPSGNGNITNDPVFVNLAAGNFRLQTSSPCINTGSGSPGLTDLDGRPRTVGGRIDIGAYEFQGSGMGEFIAWLQQYGLPTDGSADFIDSDGDGMNNWQEWIAGTDPTNALSVLEMLSPTSTNDPSGLVVSWQSVNTRTYYLQSSANLAAQPAFSTIQSNIVGQAGTTSYTDTTATNGGPYFYRVGVQ